MSQAYGNALARNLVDLPHPTLDEVLDRVHFRRAEAFIAALEADAPGLVLHGLLKVAFIADANARDARAALLRADPETGLPADWSGS